MQFEGVCLQVEKHFRRMSAERLVPDRIRVVSSEHEPVPCLVRRHAPLVVVPECELPVRHITADIFVLPVGDGTHWSEMVEMVCRESVVIPVGAACVLAHQGLALHVCRRFYSCEAED